MSADLYLYVLPNTDDSRAAIAAWEDEDGDGFIDMDTYDERAAAVFGPDWSRPSVWVGQVSWAKSDILNPDGTRRYVPDAILGVQRVTEAAPVVTPALIASVMGAMNVKNNSVYGKPYYVNGFDPEKHWGGNGTVRRIGKHRIQKVRGGRGVAKRQDVKKFLLQHPGMLVYPTSA